MSFLRIVAVSDSHGDRRTLRQILERHRDAHAVFHLGDGFADIQALREEFPALSVWTVAGNCDGMRCDAPPEREVVLGGHRFFAVHGHRYEVKHSLLRLSYAAEQRQAAITLFGHTHLPLLERVGDGYLLNPGSVRDGGRYALVDIVSGTPFLHLERY